MVFLETYERRRRSTTIIRVDGKAFNRNYTVGTYTSFHIRLFEMTERESVFLKFEMR